MVDGMSASNFARVQSNGHLQPDAVASERIKLQAGLPALTRTSGWHQVQTLLLWVSVATVSSHVNHPGHVQNMIGLSSADLMSRACQQRVHAQR